MKDYKEKRVKLSLESLEYLERLALRDNTPVNEYISKFVNGVVSRMRTDEEKSKRTPIFVWPSN